MLFVNGMARDQKLVHGGGKHYAMSDRWAEPYTIDELAIDRKKVDEVSSWLSTHKNRCGILLLTGATGSGKTALVKCLARSLGFEIREWITPLDRDYQNESGVFQNQAEKFEDFLYACSRYSDLFVKSPNIGSLLLVEDYPNIFLRSPEVFHEVLGRYSRTARAPMVFICSDVADKDLNIELELFPANVKIKLGISHTMLNPITKIKMLQALRRMGALLQALTPGYKPPSQDVLNEICDSANGDIRFAMLSLQTKPQEDVVAMFELAGKKGSGKKGTISKKVTKEEEAVSACGKDDRVGILHAAGRVLYPKWLKPGEKKQKSAVKRKRKAEDQQLDASVPGVEWVNDPNTLADSYLSSASSLLLLVQENYLKTFSAIESVAAAALCLSDTDVFMTSEGVETSHEISFNMALRGVMVHNKVPNRAWNPVRGSKYWNIVTTQRTISNMAETLFPLYPVSHTVLMTDLIPYMSHSCSKTLSNDQHNFVQKVSSMEPLSHFCETFRSFKAPHRENQGDKATFVIGSSKQVNEQDDELHISEDESDEEFDEGAANLTMLEAAMDEDFDLDEGAQNLSMLEAAIDEEEKSGSNYSANFYDSDDDDILLSQI